MGDRGLIVHFEARPSRRLTQLLAGFSSAAGQIDGVIDASPGHRTVLIEVSPGMRDRVWKHLGSMAAEAAPYRGRLHRIDARYEGEDLEWILRTTGLSLESFITVHSRRVYDVRAVGSPGFIYLSSVHRSIAVPRLDEPRMVVPAGSVGIGGKQTGIYGRARPGGWRIVASVEDVPPLSAGDRIRFIPA